MVIRHDERRRLQAVDQGVRVRQPPVGIGLVPHPVEPSPADGAVVGEQLGQLAVHEVQVAVPVAALGPAGLVSGPAPRPVVRMVPVELRVIEEELETLPLALVR